MDSIQISPTGVLGHLSQNEIDCIAMQHKPERYELFRECCLAVLNSGVESDDVNQLLNQNAAFDVRLIRRERGVKIELINPPKVAFVDDELIIGVQEHVFSVLRDIIYMAQKYEHAHSNQILNGRACTDLIFDMLRHANMLEDNDRVNTVVCWGGHSIAKHEYFYSKEVGYQLGLRDFDICTGCGPGAMKGPMKGATIGHAKQRNTQSRFIGITEPSIIAAEPPNAIVNELVIMPDIEKRLEAFVRFAHAIVIFPGGVGTAEELLYLLGILLHPDNQQQRFPVFLTGPSESAEYFTALDNFIFATLGPEAQNLYQIIIDDPVKLAREVKKSQMLIDDQRRETGDSFSFNWSLVIDERFQTPFVPNHSNMANLNLHLNQDKANLAAQLRCAFSGIVAGNIKADCMQQIAKKGPFNIHGDAELMQRLDELLNAFVAQGRMKLPGKQYTPCYQVTK